MNAAELKLDLHDKIDHADSKQLKEIYGLLINYFNGQYSPEEEWDSLPESHKRHIMKGLEEAKAGLGTPASEVIKRLCEKYGLLNQSDDDDIDAEEQAKIEESLAQADRGEVIPHEETMSKYQQWRKK